MGKYKGEEREKILTTERKKAKQSQEKRKKKKKRKEKEKKKKKKSSARGIPRRSPIQVPTSRDVACLTSVIGREPVFSTWYGRRHLTHSFTPTYTQIRQHTTPTLLPTLQRTSTPCSVPKLPSARKSHWTSKPDHSGPFLQHVHANTKNNVTERPKKFF